MPFPLPDGGPPYSEALRWFLVAVPDDPQFVRAALGAYTEFTHYWKWGKEGKEEGRAEAAQVWEDAVAATLEGLEMGFPDILLGYIDGVEALLQSLIDKPCCSGIADGLENIYDGSGLVGDEVTTDGEDVEVGVGTPPTPASDWTEYASLLCDGASAWVDGLPNLFRWSSALSEVVQTITIAGATAIIAAILAGLAVPVAVAGVLLGTLNLLEWLDDVRDKAAGSNAFETWQTEAVTYRQELICAIITADTAAQAWTNLQTAVETYFTAGAWGWINLLAFPGSIQRIFNLGSSIEGGYGGTCGTCSGSVPYIEVLVGTRGSYPNYTSEAVASCQRIELKAWDSAEKNTEWMCDWTIEQLTTSVCGGVNMYRLYDKSLTPVHNSNTAPVGVRAHYVTLVRTAAFDIDAESTNGGVT